MEVYRIQCRQHCLNALRKDLQNKGKEWLIVITVRLETDNLDFERWDEVAHFVPSGMNVCIHIKPMSVS